MAEAAARHRVVVVGGGFGGLPALRYFAHRPVDVTVVDRRNHHLFQPLLYQVATGMLSPGQIAPPIRHVVRRWKNIRVELAEVTGFDLERRIVHATSAANLFPIELPYDSLIVAAGCEPVVLRARRAGPPCPWHEDRSTTPWSCAGASSAPSRWRQVTTDPAEKERWLTMAIVGAGPTGVELAGQISELATRCLKGEFRTFDPASVRVLLLDGGKEPLATFGDRLSGKAAKQLQRLGVELRMNARVVGVDAIRRRRRSVPTEARRGSRPTRRSGRPASRRRRSPPSWPRPAAPRPTAPAASPCSPTSRCPAIPRCSRSGTWRR